MGTRRAESIRATVVVPTRNRRPLLARQVECLLAQETDGFDYEIVVVNDASSDDTAEYLRRRAAACPRLRVVHRPVPGANQARNDGVRAARGDLLLFTDDDCLAPPGWVRSYVEAFDARPGAGGIYGPVTCPADGVSPRTRQIVAPRPHPLYYACNVGYRRAVLRAVGGFDGSIPFSFGDVDLAARVLEIASIRWVPSVTTVHPPRPRTWRTTDQWRDTLFGEWTLWRRSPDFYRRTRGPTFVIGVLANWVVGSTLKDLVRHRGPAFRAPAEYVAFARDAVADKLRLLRVLPRFLADPAPARRVPTAPEPRGSPAMVPAAAGD
jgi:glycosyltransferase involved in cell wall biosynthesis